MLSFWSVRGFTVLITVNLHNKSSKVTEWKVSFFFFFLPYYSLGWLSTFLIGPAGEMGSVVSWIHGQPRSGWWLNMQDGLSAQWLAGCQPGHLGSLPSGLLFIPVGYFDLIHKVVLREQAQKEHAFMTQVHFKTLLALYLLMSPWPKQVSGQSRID